eukprot:1564088-Alexandrium_andersonii.AAC.1
MRSTLRPCVLGPSVSPRFSPWPSPWSGTPAVGPVPRVPGALPLRCALVSLLRVCLPAPLATCMPAS